MATVQVRNKFSQVVFEDDYRDNNTAHNVKRDLERGRYPSCEGYRVSVFG